MTDRRKRPSPPLAADNDGIERSPRSETDPGVTSLAVALLTPVFIALLFAAVQATLWAHTRTEARVAASDVAAQVARFGASRTDAEGSARVRLADAPISDLDVAISTSGDLVIVTITATAPGILRGTSRLISVTEAVPVERVID